MGEKLAEFGLNEELRELINKPSDLDLVTAIIYYSGIKKLTETAMLKFLKEKKEEGKNPKFFKKLSLPRISNFSNMKSSNFSDLLYTSLSDAVNHDRFLYSFHVDRTPEVKKVVLKRIKKVFDFKERLALKNLGNQFKKIIKEEKGK